jgi:hypothetical protein
MDQFEMNHTNPPEYGRCPQCGSKIIDLCEREICEDCDQPICCKCGETLLESDSHAGICDVCLRWEVEEDLDCS